MHLMCVCVCVFFIVCFGTINSMNFLFVCYSDERICSFESMKQDGESKDDGTVMI